MFFGVTVPLATGYDPFYIHGYVDIIHSFGYFLNTKWIISGYYPDILWISGYRVDIVGFQNIHGYDPHNIHSVSRPYPKYPDIIHGYAPPYPKMDTDT